MKTFFIIDTETAITTNWSPKPYLHAGPRLITEGQYEGKQGPHEGKYAIGVGILNCSPAYEVYRELLESMPTATYENVEDWWPEEEVEE